MNISEKTIEFIKKHLNDDVRTLALKASKDKDIDLQFALEQISGWRKARTKLPEWAECEGIIYPPHISMEQCSSEKTALYKAQLAQNLIKKLYNGDNNYNINKNETTLIDLTGGFGVDFSYISTIFGKAIYVERNSRLCEISEHNMKLMGRNNVEIINADSEEYICRMPDATLIFIDPARRDNNGARTFAISDCTPDVLKLKDFLLKKAPYLMIKLSPMLDWRKAVADFKGSVSEVHIVSSGNECKELLLVVEHENEGLKHIYCVNDDDVFHYNDDEYNGNNENIIYNESDDKANIPQYLYEPNASIMKAGCFNLICSRYGIRQLSTNSHLFISTENIASFPGRSFSIKAISSFNKRELKQALSDLKRANISVRNFPISVAELRKRLKLGEGGDTYLFATTTSEGKHIVFRCEKL